MSSNKKHKTCDVSGCFASSRDDPSAIFFPFPRVYQHSFETWFSFAKCEVVNPRWICGRHFDETQYEDNSRTILHGHAVPTLYPGLPTANTREASPNKPAKKVLKFKACKSEKIVSMGAPENSRNRLWSAATAPKTAASVPKTIGIGQYIPPKHLPHNFSLSLNKYGRDQHNQDDDGFVSPETVNSPVIVRTADGFIIPGTVKRAPPNFIETLNQYQPSKNVKDDEERMEPSPPKLKRLSLQCKEPSDEIKAPDINDNMKFYKKLSESLPNELPISTKFKQALEQLEEASKKGPFIIKNYMPNCHDSVEPQVMNQPSTKSTTLVLKPSSKKVDLNIDKSSFQTSLKSKPKIITAKPKIVAERWSALKAKSKLRKKAVFQPGGKKSVYVTNLSSETFPKILYATPKSQSATSSLSENNSVNNALPDTSRPVTSTALNIPDGSRLVKVDPKSVPEFLKQLTAQGNMFQPLIPDKNVLVKVGSKAVPESVKIGLQGKGNLDRQDQKSILQEKPYEEKTTVDVGPITSKNQGQKSDDVIFLGSVEVPTLSDTLKSTAIGKSKDNTVLRRDLESVSDDKEPVPDKIRLAKVNLDSLPEFVKMKIQSIRNSDSRYHTSRPIGTSLNEKTGTIQRQRNSYDDNNIDCIYNDRDSGLEYLLESAASTSPGHNVKSPEIQRSKKKHNIFVQPSLKTKVKSKTSKGSSGNVVKTYGPNRGQVNNSDVVFLGSVGKPETLLPATPKRKLKDATSNDSSGNVVCEPASDKSTSVNPDPAVHGNTGDDDVDDDVIFLKSVRSPSVDQTLKSSEPNLSRNKLSPVQTPNKPVTDAVISNNTATIINREGIPDKIKLLKVDPKSVPEYVKVLAEGKGNEQPRAEKSTDSPLVVQIKKQISAEINGTASEGKAAKSIEFITKPYKPDPLAESWEAYKKYKKESNSCNFNFVSFLLLKLASNDPMTPEHEKAALELIKKVQKTYSKPENSNPEVLGEIEATISRLMVDTAVTTENSELKALKGLSQGSKSSSRIMESARLQTTTKIKLNDTTPKYSSDAIVCDSTAFSPEGSCGDSGNSCFSSSRPSMEQSRKPLILRRSRKRNTQLTKNVKEPSNDLGNTALAKVVGSQSNQIKCPSSRKDFEVVTKSSKPPSLRKDQLHIADTEGMEVITMEHMTSCFVELTDVLKQKQITDKYLPSVKSKKESVTKAVLKPNTTPDTRILNKPTPAIHVSRDCIPDKIKLVKVDPKSVPEYVKIAVNGKGIGVFGKELGIPNFSSSRSTEGQSSKKPMRSTGRNDEKPKVCPVKLTDDSTLNLDVSCKQKKKTGKNKKFSKTSNKSTNELENRISIAESFQSVNVTQLYRGFVVLQHTTNVFECFSSLSVYTQMLIGISLVESSLDPSLRPDFLCTPQNKELEADTSTTVLVNSGLVTLVNNAIKGLRSAFHELKPFAGLEREELGIKQFCELSLILRRLLSEIAVVEMVLSTITSQNAMNPERLRATAIECFPDIQKMASDMHFPLNESSSVENEDALKGALHPRTGDTESQLRTASTGLIDPSLPQSVVFVMLMGPRLGVDGSLLRVPADQRSSGFDEYIVIVQLCYDMDENPTANDHDYEKSRPSRPDTIQPNSTLADVPKGSKPVNSASESTDEQSAMPSLPSSSKTDNCVAGKLTFKGRNVDDTSEPADLNSDSVKVHKDVSGKLSEASILEQTTVAPDQQAEVWKAYAEYKNKLLNESSKSNNDLSFSQTRLESHCSITSKLKESIIKLLAKRGLTNEAISSTISNQPEETGEFYARVDVTRLFGGFIMLEHAANNLAMTGVNLSTLSVLKMATIVLESFADNDVALMLITDFFDPKPASRDDIARKKASLVLVRQCTISKIATPLPRIRSIIDRLYSYNVPIEKGGSYVPPRILRELESIVEDLRELVSEVKDQKIPDNLKQTTSMFPGELLSRAVTVRIIIPDHPKGERSFDVKLGHSILAFSWTHTLGSNHDTFLTSLMTLLDRRHCALMRKNVNSGLSQEDKSSADETQ